MSEHSAEIGPLCYCGKPRFEKSPDCIYHQGRAADVTTESDARHKRAQEGP